MTRGMIETLSDEQLSQARKGYYVIFDIYESVYGGPSGAEHFREYLVTRDNLRAIAYERARRDSSGNAGEETEGSSYQS